MRVSIVGTGYVGLVSGACLAATGHDVTCIDLDSDKVDRINRGDPPIYEKGLSELLASVVGQRLRATTDLHSAVKTSDLSLIAVGTPFDGSAIDLAYIRGAAKGVGQALRDKDGYHTVVVKSTVVPGTTEDVVLPIVAEASGRTAGDGFGVGMNPEFLREGEAVSDFMAPDRIVLGGIDQRTLDAMEALYTPFPGVDRVRTRPRTAEMIKYTSNAMLATLISFSNEIANLCSAIGGIDAVDVMRGVHLDKRLSPILPDGRRIMPAFTTYLEAGCGFGGSCFPKDVNALISHGVARGMPMEMMKAVMSVNARQPQEIIRLLGRHFASLAGRRIAVLGVAFKPGTDDVRGSPSEPVIRALLAADAEVRLYDPVARHEAEKLFAKEPIAHCDTLRETVQGAEAVVLMTRWEEFAALPDLLAGLDPQPVVVDGRRMLDKRAVHSYEGIGL